MLKLNTMCIDDIKSQPMMYGLLLIYLRFVVEIGRR